MAYQIGVFFLTVLATSFLYQKAATMLDDFRYPPVGTLVDIGGYRLHIHSSGEGGPTVILDAGLSGTSIGWSLVQNEVSTFTRVCSFDRAGYAWSDESPLKRTTVSMTEELHTLLHRGNIPGPYILVGHSFGGCNALMFAHLYPEETIGVILVDSVQEKMLNELTLEPQGTFKQILNHSNFQRLFTALGYKRLKGPSAEITQMFAPLPEDSRRMYVAQMNKTRYVKTVSKEMEALAESLSQLRESKMHLQDKPLVVISAGKHASVKEKQIWLELQKGLLSKSNQTKWVIAESSDHMINHHQPRVITQAIREMIESQL